MLNFSFTPTNAKMGYSFFEVRAKAVLPETSIPSLPYDTTSPIMFATEQRTGAVIVNHSSLVAGELVALQVDPVQGNGSTPLLHVWTALQLLCGCDATAYVPGIVEDGSG
jgi:hypothetical protein